MKILFVCQHFPPEMGAQAARVSELARHWVKAGHEVTVLTGFPNHPNGVIHPNYKKKFRRLTARESMDGIDVVRTWLIPRPNHRPLERILNYTSFCFSASLRGSFLSRPDVVIATSPQILIAAAGRWISWIKRVPFILEIRDLWPESIVASGVGSKSSLLYRIVKSLVSFLYKTCNHMVVVTPAFKKAIIVNWGTSAEKITVITNGVETDFFTSDRESEPIKKELELEGKFVVSYIGTLGMAHGLTTVLEAASKIKQVQPDIQFLLVGDGAERDELHTKIAQRDLTNVTLLQQQPKSKIPSIICSSDVCMVLLKKQEIFKTVLPT
ncbi:MAG: glycosyltransferase family 4 protein, partial [Chloroflexi bacterium]|nr:glycosyltransferase family 4 protein [Chloroflexota bacterium]